MAQVTCHACQAFFEVDFAAGTQFTCGSCGATLQVPAEAAPTVTPRIQPKAGRKPPTGRKPVGKPAPKGAVSVNAPPPIKPVAPASMPTSGLKHAIGKDTSKRNTVIVGSIAGGVLLIVAIIVMATSSGDGDDPTRPNAGGRAGHPPVNEDPYKIAYTKAYPNGSLEDIKRLADMAWQRHKAGRGSVEDMRLWESNWRWASRQIIAREPDNALAHERLGDVLFDLKEAEALVELEDLSEDLRDNIQILIEDAEDKIKNLRKNGGRVWLSPTGKDKVLAQEWVEYRKQAEKVRSAAASRSTDSFYGTAENFGRTLAKELENSAVDFRIDGVKEEPFAIHVHKPYVFLVQRSSTGFEERIASKWNDVLQSLQETFYRLSGNDCGVPAMTKPTPVIILANGQEYVKYNRRGDQAIPTRVTSAGHFEPGNNRLVCYRSTEDAERTTLFHEGTHQIVSWAMLKGMGARALMAGMQQSLWFSEGIADYYGGHGEEYEGSTKVFVPGRINMQRIDTLVDAKARGDLMSLDVLLDYTRAMYTRDNADPTKSRRVLNAYAQGWALCYFIQNWKKDEYGAKWNEYLKAEFKGRSGKSAFTAVFGTAALPKMQGEYLEMIDALGEAKKNGKIINGKLTK